MSRATDESQGGDGDIPKSLDEEANFARSGEPLETPFAVIPTRD
jgi:hypothetical protein